MAEQFEFTKLSEVPIVETASEEANVLLEENGTIRRVPKTEVGGSGMFVVNVTDNTADAKAKTSLAVSFIADKTFNEITEAINRGENVVLKINIEGCDLIIPLVCTLLDTQHIFSSIIYMNVIKVCSVGVVINSDDTVDFMTHDIAAE